MGGRTITVNPGDTMVSIAHAEGFRSWEAIYHHAKNGPLRSQCPDPAVLEPGVPVFIPEKGTKEHDCQTTRRHVFRVKTLKARLHFTVGDENGPFASSRYELDVAGTIHAGMTSDKGAIDLRVPPDTESAHVKVWPPGATEDAPWEWDLQVGYLDPLSTDTGLRSRLANLGYPPDAGDEGLREAIERFQFDQRVEVTGVLDGTTLGKLRTHHGA